MYLCAFGVVLFSIWIAADGVPFDVKELDWSVSPGDNFYLFVNGRWLNKTVIPSSQTAWGVYAEMDYENQFLLKTILDDLIANENITVTYPPGSVKRLLADLYRAGLNEEAVELAGIEPLRESLLELEAVNDYLSLIEFTLKWYKQMNQGILFNFFVEPDEQSSMTYVAHFIVSDRFPCLTF